MSPESLPELNTEAFRRAMAAALGLPIEGERQRPQPLPLAAWDPLGSIEEDEPQRRAA